MILVMLNFKAYHDDHGRIRDWVLKWCVNIFILPHSTLLIIVIISTQNMVVNNGHVEVYHASIDELPQFHQLKRNFNNFEKFI
jgi:hypothetical protein